jgi:protein-ribulosamine 3-kinase
MIGSMIPKEIIEELERIFPQKDDGTQSIISSKPLSGGSINKSFEIKFRGGQKYFLKYNLSDRYPAMFSTEVKGLNILRDSRAVKIPQVLCNGTAGSYSYLVLQMITPGKISNSFFKNLGEGLANLHKHTNPLFGLDHNNYIGSIPQKNTLTKNFSDFFINSRLEPLAKKASIEELLPASVYDALNKLYTKIDYLIPQEPPSLLHGDLWSGNRIIGPNGHAWLIDPAVYYGHREADIAMTRLFGGFDNDFYSAYNSSHPLTLGWQERVDLHNLYPLLVHLNLFGKSYLPQITQIINKFT